MFGFDFSSITNSISNMFSGGASSISNMFDSGASSISNEVGDIWSSMPSFGGSGSSDIGDFFSSGVSSFSNGISNMYDNFSMPSFGGSDSSSNYNPFASLGDMLGGLDLSQLFSSTCEASGNFASNADQQVTGDFSDIINEAASKYGVKAKLIKSIMMTESAGDPNAISPCGAQGLMQMMPETFAATGYSNALDPRESVMAGTSHVLSLLEHFGGDTTKVIAAYNAGAGAVDKYDGVPPYEETQKYVQKVTDYMNSMA